MNGCVIPGTPIAVDTWKIRECVGVKLFFLTHLHGDHIVGLTSSWDRPLYCSDITAQILTKRYKIKSELVHALEVNESHLISVNNETGNQEFVTVTVIDALHCPGSVMFLFEGCFGKILHTGDFRYSDSSITFQLQKHLGTVDVLYLDNTYCSPGCEFPSRSEATQRIIDIVHQHKEHDIVFGMRSLGKEDMLVKVALDCKEWISVPSSILEVADILNLPNVFVSHDDPTPHRLRVVPFASISSKNVAKWNLEEPTIAILPTALYTGINGEPFVNNKNVFVVAYSDHSSYSEIHKFVSQVQPKRIVPIVRGDSRGLFGADISSRADMSCFNQFLNSNFSPENVAKRRKLNHDQAPIELINSALTTRDKMNSIETNKTSSSKPHRMKMLRRKGSIGKPKGVEYDSDTCTHEAAVESSASSVDASSSDKENDTVKTPPNQENLKSHKRLELDWEDSSEQKSDLTIVSEECSKALCNNPSVHVAVACERNSRSSGKTMSNIYPSTSTNIQIDCESVDDKYCQEKKQEQNHESGTNFGNINNNCITVDKCLIGAYKNSNYNNQLILLEDPLGKNPKSQIALDSLDPNIKPIKFQGEEPVIESNYKEICNDTGDPFEINMETIPLKHTVGQSEQMNNIRLSQCKKVTESSERNSPSTNNETHSINLSVGKSKTKNVDGTTKEDFVQIMEKPIKYRDACIDTNEEFGISYESTSVASNIVQKDHLEDNNQTLIVSRAPLENSNKYTKSRQETFSVTKYSKEHNTRKRKRFYSCIEECLRQKAYHQ